MDDATDDDRLDKMTPTTTQNDAICRHTVDGAEQPVRVLCYPMAQRENLPADPRKLVVTLSTTRRRMLRRRVVILAGPDASESDVDDICQEVFDRILAYGGDHVDKVEAWLWDVIKSSCVIWFRKCGYIHRNPMYSQRPAGDLNDYSPSTPAKRTACPPREEWDK